MMMFKRCLQEKEQLLFLKRREINNRMGSGKVEAPTEGLRMMKRSLRSLGSQKSLKTADSNRLPPLPLASLHSGDKSQKTRLTSPFIVRNSNEFKSPTIRDSNPEENKILVRNSLKIDRRATYPLPREEPKVQRISFTFQQNLAPIQIKTTKPLCCQQKQEVDEKDPLTPQTYCSQTERLQVSLSMVKEEPISISIMSAFEKSCRTERDNSFYMNEESQSGYTSSNLLMPSLRINDNAKSAVSLLSERSEIDSVVMQHYEIEGVLTKLF